MQVLIAGPGTGKTSKVKSIVDESYPNAEQVLVLSFTNATVNDLTSSFSNYSNVICYTLHSYALRINHQRNLYILDANKEAMILENLAEDLDIDLPYLCSQLECITFDEMIHDCLQFLKTNEVYAQAQIGNLDLLVVDEYQDFNEVERQLVKEISKYSEDTIILGDDDQSIYGFKDADPDGIIDLLNSEDIEQIEHDHICYRCPDIIVESASKLISHNEHRVNKPWNPSGKDGMLIQNQFLTQLEANEFIIEEIRKIKKENQNLTFLVLSPVRFYVGQLINLLDEREISYVNFWNRNIEPDQYHKIWWLRFIYSRRKLLNLLFLSETLTPHYRRRLKEYLYTAFREGQNQINIIQHISNFYSQPYTEYLDNPPQLDEFRELHPEFKDLIDSLDPEKIDPSMDNIIKEMNPQREFDQDAINIMSIHKSKGLQADIVFINGLVDGVLPNETIGLDSIEAQRRLLFVGLTRALKRLYLVSPIEWEGKYVHRIDKDQFNFDYRSGLYRGQTSRFVREFKLTK